MSIRRDRGAAAVEMAILTPLLLLIVFGIMDFGLLLNAQIGVTEAAREGARAATIDVANPTAAQDRVSLINPDYTVDTAASTKCSATPAPGSNAVVVVRYRHTWLTPVGGLVGLLGGDSWSDYADLTGKGVMPCRA
jgi:Flp pilus assembly protein TadG